MRLIFVVLLASSILSGCFVSPSRSYEGFTRNVKILEQGALNIDFIKPVNVTVASSRSWQNTGVFVENGDRVNITAHGSWSPSPALLAWSGPEGNALWNVEVPGITGGALMARIGTEGYPFEVGLGRTFQSQGYGMLYLAMNDPFRFLFDNKGEVTAEVYHNGHKVEGKSVAPQTLDIISYYYDDTTNKGSIAAKLGTQPFLTRQRLVKKIGEIASSKNIAIRAGQESIRDGVYKLLGEHSQDGVLKIDFETLW